MRLRCSERKYTTLGQFFEGYTGRDDGSLSGTFSNNSVCRFAQRAPIFAGVPIGGNLLSIRTISGRRVEGNGCRGG